MDKKRLDRSSVLRLLRWIYWVTMALNDSREYTLFISCKNNFVCDKQKWYTFPIFLRMFSRFLFNWLSHRIIQKPFPAPNKNKAISARWSFLSRIKPIKYSHIHLRQLCTLNVFLPVYSLRHWRHLEAIVFASKPVLADTRSLHQSDTDFAASRDTDPRAPMHVGVYFNRPVRRIV